MNERAFWEIVYHSLMAIAAAIKKYKIEAIELVAERLCLYGLWLSFSFF